MRGRDLALVDPPLLGDERQVRPVVGHRDLDQSQVARDGVRLPAREQVAQGSGLGDPVEEHRGRGRDHLVGSDVAVSRPGGEGAGGAGVVDLDEQGVVADRAEVHGTQSGLFTRQFTREGLSGKPGTGQHGADAAASK